MLIHLHRSAIDAAAEGEGAERAGECLDLLLGMHHEGHHLVSITPEDLLRLASIGQRLSRRARGALARIAGKSSEILSIRKSLRWHLELGTGDGFDGGAHPLAGGARVIRAPLDHFDRTTRVVRSALMGENLTDVTFYVELGYLALFARRRRGIRLHYEHVPGGGSQFARYFAQLATEGRIILAIADSDRKEPGGAVGDTWKGLERQARETAGHAFQRAREIHVREAENLIPLDVYQRVFLEENAPDRDLLLSSLRALRPLSAADRCHEDLKEKLSKRVLERAVRWLQSERIRNPSEVAALFDLPGDAALGELCDEIVAWGCALPEMLG